MDIISTDYVCVCITSPSKVPHGYVQVSDHDLSRSICTQFKPLPEKACDIPLQDAGREGVSIYLVNTGLPLTKLTVCISIRLLPTPATAAAGLSSARK